MPKMVGAYHQEFVGAEDDCMARIIRDLSGPKMVGAYHQGFVGAEDDCMARIIRDLSGPRMVGAYHQGFVGAEYDCMAHIISSSLRLRHLRLIASSHTVSGSLDYAISRKFWYEMFLK